MLRIHLFVGLAGTLALSLGGCVGGGSFFGRASPSDSALQEQAAGAPSNTAIANGGQGPGPADTTDGDAGPDRVLENLKPLSDGDPQLLADFRRALDEADPRLRTMLLARLEAQQLYNQRASQTVDPESEAASHLVDAPRSPTSDAHVTKPSDATSPAASEATDPATRHDSQARSSSAVPAPPARIAQPSDSAVAASPTDPQDSVAVATNEAPDEEEEEPGDWKEQLHAAIESVEKELLGYRLNENERPRLETYLRLLYLVENRRGDAVKPIADVDENQQEFWSQQLYALSEILDEQGTPVIDRRATLALRHLRRAENRLANMSTLDVRNLSFCTETVSYGHYTPFAEYEFQPNQEVLLYLEVDNFTVAEKGAGYETTLMGSYQILDAAGRRMADHTFPADTETSPVRRRDFFISYHVYLPKTLPPGGYTLQLTVEDINGKKFGQGSIEFSVVTPR